MLDVSNSEGGEVVNEVQRRGRNDQNLNRLRAFDKHYLEKASLVRNIINLA